MIPGSDLSRCRCGVAFKFVGYGKRLCPPCMAKYKARRMAEYGYPKCRCGATLSLLRVADGKEICGRCETSIKDRLKAEALGRHADQLLRRGL